MLDGSDCNTVSGNRAMDNDNSFGLGFGATENQFVGNTATGGIHGFYLGVATGNLINGNTVSNTDTGYQLTDGSVGNRWPDAMLSVSVLLSDCRR